MNQTEKTASPESESKKESWVKNIPWPIIIGLVLGLVAGILLGAGNPKPELKPLIDNLEIPTNLVFQALKALAAPLVLLALLDTLISKEISGKQGRNLVLFILLNTIVAIIIGLVVVTILNPGSSVNLDGITNAARTEPARSLWEILREFFISLISGALLKALVENNFISLVLIGLGFGSILRGIRLEQESQDKTDSQSLEKIIKVLSEAIEGILKWVIALLPIAVFGIVAKTFAEKGFEPFISFSGLILAMLLALFLQACYYLVIIKLGSWVNPFDFLRKASKPLQLAFCTASSTTTMPIAEKALVKKIGLRKDSAALGVNLGGNISKNGVAIFQTMFALFVAQILGQSFSPGQYLILALLSIFSSICTVGVPGGGIIMTILVFNSVFTDSEVAINYIALVLSVYWFLDMCSTTINVMGYMTLATLLDGKEKGDELIA